MTKPATAQDAVSHSDEVTPGSERSFGLVFAAVFALIAFWPMLGGEPIRTWAAGVAAAFLAVALLAPRLLRPLNVVWFKFGMLLHKVVNPVVMGLLFFVAITPIALLMRLAGKDPLHRAFDADAESYWIERAPPGPAPETMKQQF